jgi:K+-transporting ATPase c subunit
MADEEILVLLQQIASKVDAQGDKLDRVAADQTALRTETNAKLDRIDGKVDALTTRVDGLDAKVTRAAARADDGLAAQVRTATDIAAIRSHLQEEGRGELRQELESLRERVEVLERR